MAVRRIQLLPLTSLFGGLLRESALHLFSVTIQIMQMNSNLSITIKPNICTVLMGPSGCGKSTLAKLLLGFVQPQEGNIKLDDKDIRYLSANELRNAFGVVPQETMLFSGTIYDNLTLANPHASFEQIIQACQLAGIHETLEKLPEGYQTQIGEHGTGLSGGQKQRLAIARALLRQPNILILMKQPVTLTSTPQNSLRKPSISLKAKSPFCSLPISCLKAWLWMRPYC